MNVYKYIGTSGMFFTKNTIYIGMLNIGDSDSAAVDNEGVLRYIFFLPRYFEEV
jgi:hypothetical protein